MSRLLSGAAVVAAAGLAGLQFAPVFTLTSLLAPVLAVCAAVLVADLATTRIGLLRAPLALLLSLVAAFVTAFGAPTAGNLEAFADGAVNGWLRTLDSTLPAHPDPRLYLFVPLLVMGAAIVGTEFLRWLDAGVLALAPSLVVLVAAQAFQALDGLSVLLVGVGYVVLGAVVLLTTRQQGSRARRPLQSTVVPAVVTLVAVFAGATVFAATSVIGARPYSLPAQHTPPPLDAAVDNPLTQLGGRLATPNDAVFSNDAGRAADLWRVAVLDTYDAGTWSSGARFKPLGTRLPDDPTITADTRTATARIHVGAGQDAWLPTTGRTVSVDGVPALVDPDSGTIRSDDARGGTDYRLRWESVRVPADDLPSELASRPRQPVPLPAEATELSETATRATAGRRASVEAALQLEQWFRTQKFRLVGPGATDIPTGHGIAQLTRFVEDKRGTSEQFAAAYAVMAQSVGIPVRVAVGFRQPAHARPGATITVRNADVYAWPEIPVRGYGWVPLNPSGQAAGDGGGSGDDVAVALNKKRDQLSEKDGSETDKSEEDKPSDVASAATEAHWHWTSLFALLAVPAIPLLALAGVIAAKALRRRRRQDGDPHEAILGAWREVRDRLRDYGHGMAPGMTARDVASTLPPDVAASAGQHIGVLARCVDEAVWSRVGASRQLASTAWTSAHHVDEVLAGRPWHQRLRAAVALTSLRPPP